MSVLLNGGRGRAHPSRALYAIAACPRPTNGVSVPSSIHEPHAAGHGHVALPCCPSRAAVPRRAADGRLAPNVAGTCCKRPAHQGSLKTSIPPAPPSRIWFWPRMMCLTDFALSIPSLVRYDYPRNTILPARQSPNYMSQLFRCAVSLETVGIRSWELTS